MESAAGALILLAKWAEAFVGSYVQRAIFIARLSQLSRSVEESLGPSSQAPRDDDGRLMVSSLHVDLVAHSAWHWQAAGKCRLNVQQLIITGATRELAIAFPGIAQALSAEPLSRWVVKEAIITEVECQCLEYVLGIYIERLRDLVSALDSVHTSLDRLELHGVTLCPTECDLLFHGLQGTGPLELALATCDCDRAFLTSRLESMGETRSGTNGVLVCKTLSRSRHGSVASFGAPALIDALESKMCYIVSCLREGGVSASYVAQTLHVVGAIADELAEQIQHEDL